MGDHGTVVTEVVIRGHALLPRMRLVLCDAPDGGAAAPIRASASKLVFRARFGDRSALRQSFLCLRDPPWRSDRGPSQPITKECDGRLERKGFGRECQDASHTKPAQIHL